MPALQKRSDLINLEQYENLPEDSQIEVFDGIINNMASQSEDHQTISMELSTSIRKLQDFIIEIVSPGNPADDYIRKLYYYQNAVVKEYWIVDPRRKTVNVNYFEKNLLNIQYSFDSIIKVNIYEDLYIDFSEISSRLSD